MLHGPYPAALRGSLESLQRQNSRLDAEGLQRVEDDRDLEFRIAHKLLVPLPASENLSVNPRLPSNAATAAPGRRNSSPIWRACTKLCSIGRCGWIRRCAR